MYPIQLTDISWWSNGCIPFSPKEFSLKTAPPLREIFSVKMEFGEIHFRRRWTKPKTTRYNFTLILFLIVANKSLKSWFFMWSCTQKVLNMSEKKTQFRPGRVRVPQTWILRSLFDIMQNICSCTHRPIDRWYLISYWE
jgi:hypothetical protein